MKNKKDTTFILREDILKASDLVGKEHKLPTSTKDKIIRVTSEVLEQMRIYKARQEIKQKKRITFSDALQILLNEINRI